MTILLSLVLWMAANASPAPCPAASGVTSAAACKCGYPSVEGAFDASRTVFSGVVLDVRAIPWITSIDSTGTLIEARRGLWDNVVTLRVTRGWKGAQPADTIALHDVMMCGVGFQTGEEYLVYGYVSDDGTPYTTPCQRTRSISPSDGVDGFRLPPAGEDMRMLDSIVRARRP